MAKLKVSVVMIIIVVYCGGVHVLVISDQPSQFLN